MWHLAMETIGLAGSVALFQGGELVERVSLATESGSARNLMPAIDGLLGGQKLRARQLEMVSLAHGPGSFTGLRVGVSTAKAFGFALRVPVVAVDTLEVLVHSLARRAIENGLGKAVLAPATPSSGDAASSVPASLCLCGAIDAYRKQVFRCVASLEFSKNTSGATESLIRILDKSHCYDAVMWQTFPSAAMPEVKQTAGGSISVTSFAEEAETHLVSAVFSEVTELKIDTELVGMSDGVKHQKRYQDQVRSRWPLVVGGNALHKYPLAESLSERVIFSSEADIDAMDVGSLAWAHFQSGVTTDPLKLLPNYLRGSAAEEKKI
ncbi:MAG: tRNA threonylcarbamoyladenosine biosynthesis protein TsaB [Planctomycetota bacterium]|jgi:tRNA threonylcarbamoyl adenosine modification protein YeaZ